MAGSGYRLGVDLGTTWTAAAVERGGMVEMVGLGDRSTAVPSVLHLGADGAVLVGEAADRRGPSEPDRVARQFKRRVGDPTPLLIGGTPHSAEALTAMLLRWVIAKVAELEGGPADRIAVTHPANWGPYKKDLLAQSIRLADATADLTLTEPEAAAIAYAANARVEPGSLIAVYDLGGGTFDAAVLRKTEAGFAVLGRPEGIERLGGIDFDEAVLGHVRGALGDALDEADLDDPATLAALTRLRRECVEAKEALSTDTQVSIPILLPGVQTNVRLTRTEFEQLVRPTLTATVDALRRALATAEVAPDDVTAVLLVGGSSRIPLVSELVSDAFGRPVAVDAHPKHAIALGAAHALGGHAGDRTVPAAVGGSSEAAAVTAAAAVVGTVEGPADDPLRDIVPLSGRRGVDSWGPAEGTARGATIHGTSGRNGAGGGATDPAPDTDDDQPAWAAQHEDGTRRRVGIIAAAAVLLLVALAVSASALMNGGLLGGGDGTDRPVTDPPVTDDDPQGDRDRPQTRSGNNQPVTGNGQPEGEVGNEVPPVDGTTQQAPVETPTQPDGGGGEQPGDGDEQSGIDDEQPVDGGEQPVDGGEQAGDVVPDTDDSVLDGSGTADKDDTDADTAASGSGGATDEDPVLSDPDARPQGQERPSDGPGTAESAAAGL